MDNEKSEIIKDKNLDKLISIWEKTIDLQMHFNEICMNIRKTAVGSLGVLLAAGAIAFRFGGELIILKKEVSIAFLFTAISLVVWLSFYAMDRYWYHELLRSTVKYSESLKDPAKNLGLPFPLDMSSKIREANHKALKMSGSNKVDLFYGLIAFILVISCLLLFSGAIQPLIKNK